MPRITEYAAPEGLGFRPTETGISAVAAAARRVQGEYNEAAGAIEGTGQRVSSAIRDAGRVATDYLDHRLISQGAPALAGLIAGKTKEWNDIAKNADPRDPTVAPKFLEGLETDLEKFKSAFYTEKSQQWAESHVDQFRQHMFTKTSGDISAAAGHAALIGAVQTANSLSTAARLDPSQRDFLLNTLDSTLTTTVDSNPNITGIAGQKIRNEIKQTAAEQIVKNAAMGHIEKTGEMPPWISDEKYKGYIKGDELKQFQRAAESYKRMDVAETRAETIRADHEARTKLNNDFVKLDMSMITEDGDVVASKQSIAAFKKIIENNPRGAALEERTVNAKMRSLEAMIKAREKSAGAPDDPKTLTDFNDRLFDPDNPTTTLQIGIARNEGKLSANSAKTLTPIIKELEKTPMRGPVWQGIVTGVKARLAPSLLNPLESLNDPKGAANYSSFMNEFGTEVMRLKRANQLPPNWSNINDPQSLISQTLASYVGKSSMQDQFRPMPGRSTPAPLPAQGEGSFNDRFGGPALTAPKIMILPRKPDETIADWERRKAAQ